MSHFSCLVITDNKPSEDELQEILLPWHEYECTGIERYLQEIDITDEILEYYNRSRSVVILADGSVHDQYNSKFYIKEKGEDDIFSRDVFKLPEGATTSEMPAEEARKLGIGYKDLAECAKDNYGSAFFRDGRWYRRTNPNKKWDWWQIGGRWSGFLVPHYDPTLNPDNFETCIICGGSGKRYDKIAVEERSKRIIKQVEEGKLTEAIENLKEIATCNGCDGKGKRLKWPTHREKVEGDQLRWGDVPILALRNEAEREALKKYDKAKAIMGDRQAPNWTELRERMMAEGKTIDECRDAFHKDPVIVDLKKEKEFFWLDDYSEFNVSRTEYALKARCKAAVTFAVVKDGKWYERGEMGWWAVVHDEKNDWEAEYEKLLDGLDPNKWVSVIDAHI